VVSIFHAMLKNVSVHDDILSLGFTAAFILSITIQVSMC
jgi:hypothetical protein